MITRQLFDRIFPTAGLSPRKYNLVRRRDDLIAAMNRILPRYAITTYLRICAFWSCCGVETDYFRTTEEYASGAAYDTRTDLGNTRERDGDGARYKGSSLIQTTGLYNFWRVTVRFVKKKTGKDWSIAEKRYRNFVAYTESQDYADFLKEADRLGVNFIKHPERLRDDIDIAVEAACIFWEENNLNHYADRGLIKELNGIVNRGSADKTPLHWAKRNELYSLCKRRVPKDFSFAGSLIANKIDEQNPAVQANQGENSDLRSNGNPVVLTPTNDAPASSNSLEASSASEQTAIPEKSKLKELSEKYLKHCPKDKIGNILTVVGARCGSSISSVWLFGLSGKILLIVAALSIVGFSTYALYYYSPRIWGWLTDIGDSFAPAE